MSARRRATGWLLAAAALLAFLLQARGLRSGFFGDDFALILQNPDITGRSDLGAVLLGDWFARPGAVGALGYYRPVSKASLRLTWAAAGASPFAFHLGNLLAHAAAVALFGMLAVAVAGRLAGILAAFLYAAHPMTVQAVQNVTARSDLLAAGFSFLACLAFVRWCRGSRMALAGTAAAAALAVSSKESALLLPVLLALLGRLLEVPWKRLRAGLLAPTAAVLALVALRLFVVHVRPLPNALAELGWGGRVACAFEALGAYVPPLLSGAPIIRLPQVPTSPFDPLLLTGIAIAASGAYVAFRGRLRSGASFGVLLVATTIAPVMAVWLLRIGMWKREVPVAERWLYAPLAGVCLLAGIALARLGARRAAAVTAGFAIAYGATTVATVPAYESDTAYEEYRAATYLAHAPRNPREEYFQGFYRAKRALGAGDRGGALAELRWMDARAPGLPAHLLPMARLELELGRPEAAAATAARLLSPEFAASPELSAQRDAMGDDTLLRIPRAPVLELLGRALAASGRREEARSALARAASEAPTEAERLRLRNLSAYLLDRVP